VETISVDVRIVAATNEELSKMVDEGRFRKDLFYRLNVIPIHLPPLRERREDIPILVMHFLKRFAQKNNRNVDGLSREAMDRLANYNWPGNVRELENLVEQAVVLARGPIVEVDDLRLPVSQPHYMWEPGHEVDTVPLSKVVEGPERAYIVEILRKFGGNKRKTAEILGLSRSMLYNKLRQYDVKAHEYS
jgi:DNA-binding NtrC family response regulator